MAILVVSGLAPRRAAQQPQILGDDIYREKCGNSICQDRRFLYTHMKGLESYFHYRNLDVSTLKELAARWAPEVKDSFHKGSTHLALDDIRESIAELQHYRKHFIKA